MKCRGLVALLRMPAPPLAAATVGWAHAPIVITLGGAQGGWSGGAKSA